jgi:toxin-antitoxin system PIN domain toxin
MLVDINLLVYAVITIVPHHQRSREWLDAMLNSGVPVGMPWHSIMGFIRVSTNQKAFDIGMTIPEAWRIATTWLGRKNVWIPMPTSRHQEVLHNLIACMPKMPHKLVMDAHLAAIAIEHGLTLASADNDFAKFPGLRHINPLTTQ